MFLNESQKSYSTEPSLPCNLKASENQHLIRSECVRQKTCTLRQQYIINPFSRAPFRMICSLSENSVLTRTFRIALTALLHNMDFQLESAEISFKSTLDYFIIDVMPWLQYSLR